MIEEPDRALNDCWAQVHVALRRRAVMCPASFWIARGGESTIVRGGWELVVPAANVPTNGAMTVYADKRSAFSDGSVDLVSRHDGAPAVRVRLERDTSATIGGVVIHAVTRESIAGVTVSVAGGNTRTAVARVG